MAISVMTTVFFPFSHLCITLRLWGRHAMQQNVSTAQTPQVVTAAHSQIPPVAHYVSVVAAKAG